jgi:hypothetical protein
MSVIGRTPKDRAVEASVAATTALGGRYRSSSVPPLWPVPTGEVLGHRSTAQLEIRKVP